MKILMDTNVFLDIVLQRDHLVGYSTKIMDLVKNTSVAGFIPAQAIPTIYFVVKKYYSNSLALDFLKDITAICQVLPLTNDIIQSAFRLEFTDFEDALISETAHRENCNYIVTNNVKDFKKSTILAISPNQLLERI